MEKKKVGRKPLNIEKKVVALFVSKEKIQQLGGQKAIREKLYKALETITVVAIILLCLAGDSIFNF